MARIRDLGISAIPLTMRPLEIGAGAAFEVGAAQTAAYLCAGPTQNCLSCVCDQAGSTKQDTSLSCEPPSNCPHPTCHDSRCPNSHHKPGHKASSFTPEVVAQLKQQLRARRTELNH
jgi:hypothetical protein